MTSGAWTSWALPGWWNQSTTDRPRNQETLLSSRVFWSYSSFTELGQRVLHSLTVVYKRHWRFDARTLLITPIHRAFMTCLQIQRRQKKKKEAGFYQKKAMVVVGTCETFLLRIGSIDRQPVLRNILASRSLFLPCETGLIKKQMSIVITSTAEILVLLNIAIIGLIDRFVIYVLLNLYGLFKAEDIFCIMRFLFLWINNLTIIKLNLYYIRMIFLDIISIKIKTVELFFLV